MEFIELAKKRRSVRSYSSQQVEKEKIEKCIEAARLAPSACNSQPWKFIVVEDSGLRKKIARESGGGVLPMNKFVKEAPVIIVLVREKSKIVAQLGGKLKKKEYSLIDIGIAAEHLCLQATELELGTCMLGWFNEEAIKKILSIPEARRISLLITLGYPDTDEKKEKKRKSMEEIISYNSY